MPYLSLYRKYRPRSFAEVVGQRHVTQTLANAVTAGRIAHAYLFTGPRGTGKTSTARVLAMALNCEEGASAEPCGHCESCRRIVAGSALDVIEIDAASNRGIDEIRELRERVGLAPAESRQKIYIIDEVHMLTGEAFNAFLKTLEEPPRHVVFVLATTEPHRVLPTILSRCQRFDFHRLSLQDIEHEIHRIAGLEGISVDDRATTMLAHAAEGGMRDALTLLDQAIAYAEGAVTAEVVSEILGGIDFDLMSEFTDVFTRKDTGGALQLIRQVVADGKDLKQLIVNLIGHYRNLLLLAVDRRAGEALALPEDVARRTREQAQSLSAEEVVRTLDVLAETDRELRFTSQPGLLVELAAVKVCREPAAVPAPAARPAPAPRAEPKRPPAHTSPPAPAPPPRVAESSAPATEEPEAPPAAVAPAGNEEDTLAEIRRQWDQVIAATNRSKGAGRNLAALLREATPTALHDGVLTLTFGADYGFHRDQVANSEPRRTAITQVIAQLFGVKVGLRCALARETDPPPPSSPQPKLIQEVLTTFPGSTVEE